MARIVQKYGGTSVGDTSRIKNVANRVKAVRDAGNEVVVVVSARAGVTNELIARAKEIVNNSGEGKGEVRVQGREGKFRDGISGHHNESPAADKKH